MLKKIYVLSTAEILKVIARKVECPVIADYICYYKIFRIIYW